MNPIDEMKTQAAHLSASRKVIDTVAPALYIHLLKHCPAEHKAAWLAETLANLVYETLYTLVDANLEQAEFYVEAVRYALTREVVIVEDD